MGFGGGCYAVSGGLFRVVGPFGSLVPSIAASVSNSFCDGVGEAFATPDDEPLRVWIAMTSAE